MEHQTGTTILKKRRALSNHIRLKESLSFSPIAVCLFYVSAALWSNPLRTRRIFFLAKILIIIKTAEQLKRPPFH
jgi:hypothetical protein